MSLNPNQWVKLVAQNRAKAIFVSWTEAEMEELKKSNFSQEVADRLRGVVAKVEEPKVEPKVEEEKVEEQEAEAPAVDPDNEEKEEEPKKETKKVKKTKTKK